MPKKPKEKYVYIISNKKAFWGYHRVAATQDIKELLSFYQTADPHRSYEIKFAVLTPSFKEVTAYIRKEFSADKSGWVKAPRENIVAAIRKKIATDHIKAKFIRPSQLPMKKSAVLEKTVYVISNNKTFPGYYKVGIAQDFKVRFGDYQVASPHRSYNVEHELLTPHFKEVERHIHSKFSAKGEWVRRPLQKIIAEIERYDQPPPSEAEVMNIIDDMRKDPGKRGGYYTLDNVQLLCGSCNSAKGEKSWSQFITERKRQVAREVRDDPDVPRYDG